jgi:hypothetical protein
MSPEHIGPDLERLGVRKAVTVRKVAALSVACLVVLFVPQASAREARVRGPWLLVSLASLGQVTWRCDLSRHPGVAPGLPGLALGFRPFPVSQSGGVRLLAGGRTILRGFIRPQPIRLPYLHARVQHLAIWEGGEDGTLRAFVDVDFAAGSTSDYCWPYMPPKTDVRLLPRR